MDAVAVAVAKAVTTRIQEAEARKEFSQRFTVERSYGDWEIKQNESDNLVLRESEKLRVDVVPSRTESSVALATRGSLQLLVAISVAIRRKFGPDKQNDNTGRIQIEEIDKLMLLTQELYMLLTPQRLAHDFQYPVWDGENGGTKILVAPHQHLWDLRQFTSIIQVVFRTDVKL